MLQHGAQRRITITDHTEQGSIVYVFDRFIMDPLVISPETVHAETKKPNRRKKFFRQEIR